MKPKAGRPGDRASGSQTSQTITTAAATTAAICRDSTADTDTHPALNAADAVMYVHRYHWEQAIRREVRRGVLFSADELQIRYRLPELGNATGGVFLAMRRKGLIRRVGYRPSSKPSRAGGVVAIWQRAR